MLVWDKIIYFFYINSLEYRCIYRQKKRLYMDYMDYGYNCWGIAVTDCSDWFFSFNGLENSSCQHLAHSEETLSNLQPYQGKNAININNSKNLTISHVSSKFFHNLMNFFICKMHSMSVDFSCNDSWWKIREKKKKKHTDLTWFGRLPTSMGTGKKTFTISQIRVT